MTVGTRRRWSCASEEETRALGRSLAAELVPDGILLLYGELGSGKTVLAQGVAAGLGIDPREVQSPSFVLERVHRGPEVELHHLDLYRLEGEEAVAAGLEEALGGPGVKVVEWAERLSAPVPGAVLLHLEVEEDGKRRITELGPPASGGGP